MNNHNWVGTGGKSFRCLGCGLAFPSDASAPQTACVPEMIEPLAWTRMVDLLSEEVEQPVLNGRYLVRDKAGLVVVSTWEESGDGRYRGFCSNYESWLNADMIDCYCPYPKGPQP